MHSLFDNNRPTTIGLKLAICTFVCVSLLGIVYVATKDSIAEAQLRKLSQQLADILAQTPYDNAPETDTITVTDRLLGDDKPHTVWRARQQGQPLAIVMDVSAPYGYNGPINLLIGISLDGSVTGVRVLEHKETPGLGDAIELTRSDWIKSFDSQSLTALPTQRWRVKKEGGDFDQFTGATITPRAIVNAVHDALVYYRDNQERLFD